MGTFLGALAITCLLGRALLHATRRWPATVARLIAVHAAVLGFCFVAGGFGFSTDGDFAGGAALAIYGPAVMVWLAADIYRLKRGLAEVRGPASPTWERGP